HEPDDVWPRIRRRGRAEWSVELFDHLRLPLEDEHVRTAKRAHVERLVAGVENQDLLHAGRNVAHAAAAFQLARWLMPRDRLNRGVSWPLWGAATCRRRCSKHRCRCDGAKRTACGARLRRAALAGSGPDRPDRAAG